MRYALLIIFISECFLIRAQHNYSNPNLFTTKDGLTNNTIYCITQDSRGFLWLGTKEGLNRFDGSKFRQYFAEKNNYNSLPNNNIFSIIEYQYGQLLIATGSGLAVLNTLTGKFENEKIKTSPLLAGSRITINSLFKDPIGRIWINHSGEIEILDTNLNYVHRFSDLHWAKNIKGILVRFGKWQVDKNNRIWVASDTSGINIIDPKAKQVWNTKNNPHNLAFLKHTYMRSFLLEEDSSILWYAPWGLGLIQHNLNSNKESSQTFGYKVASEDGTINSILKNKDGNLFCAGGSTLYELEPDNLTYQTINQNYGISLFQSADLLYWEATDRGLLKLPGPSYAKKILLANKNNNPLKDCSGILLTPAAKLYILYRSTTLVEMESNRSSYSIYDRKKNKENEFNCFAADNMGRLWIGTQQGIVIFDQDKHNFYSPTFLPAEVLQAKINVIFCDEEGDVWIITKTPFSIYRYRSKQNKTEKIKNNVIDHFSSLNKGSRISQVAEDKDHNLWMISQLGGGIICYNKGKNSWKLFPNNTTKNRLIKERGLTSLTNDSEHALWTTDFYGSGLIHYNYETDSISLFTRNDGLLSDYILTVCPDNENNLIITTENGVTLFNTSTFTAKSKGYPNNLVFEPDAQPKTIFDQTTNSLIYLFDNQLIFIPVNKIREASSPVKPIIDKISVNNKPFYADPELAKLSLTHENNNIAIDFTAVQFSEIDKIDFDYQLSEIDREWKHAGENHSAQYANLSPGKYIFKLRAGNENNNSGSSYTTLSFNISPPWWQTWWFKIGMLALIVSSVFALLKMRIKAIKKEAGLKHKIAETEMMALRAQMNPHFVFNCLSAIDNMIQTGQKDKATTYLTRFAQLIRIILDSSKNNIVPFYKDFESLKLFLQLEQFRSNNKFEFELNADPEILNSGIMVPPLVIQPFVENAIHHGLMNKPEADRKLSIQIILEKEYIKYTIEDNGVGRQKASELNHVNRPEHISYGIEIAKKRISLHNNNGLRSEVLITDLGNNNGVSGTKIELWLSVK